MVVVVVVHPSAEALLACAAGPAAIRNGTLGLIKPSIPGREAHGFKPARHGSWH